MTLMDTARSASSADRIWEQEILPALDQYIRIPNRSPTFDADWQQAGHMDRAVELIAGWCKQQPLAGLTVEVVRLAGRTPLIYMEVPGSPGASAQDTVLLYGHLDKQPEMTGWLEGSGPWTPRYVDGKLYGRGGADDGYAVYASLAALSAIQAEGLPHARCVGLIETCEESGSYDLPAYLEALAPRMGRVDFVIGLDSGAGDYERLWLTTSLRGIAAGTLSVEVLTEGVHSGDASGVVPSSFRIARKLLDRLEEGASGRILPAAFHAPIPEERVAQARVAAGILGDTMVKRFPWSGGTRPMVDEKAEVVLNRTWRPALSITGADGLPPIANAGNVLRPATKLKLSLRIPPTIDGERATAELKKLLEADPPHGATVRFEPDQGATGWNAPATARWLADAVDASSRTFYGQPSGAIGEGGTIPFMGMLGKQFPEAQFLITGVLGPKSNAHGPNEFLHVPYAKRLNACVAQVIVAHAQRAA